MNLHHHIKSLIISGSVVPAILFLIVVSFSFFFFLPGLHDLHAQTRSAQDTIGQEIAPIPVPEITLQATQVSSTLREKRSVLLTEDQKSILTSRMDTLIFRLTLISEDPRVHKTESLNFRSLQNLENDWTLLNSRLVDEQSSLNSQVQHLENEKAVLEEMHSVWQKTLQSTSDTDAPPSVIEQIRSTLRDIEQLQFFIQSDSEFLQEKMVLISEGLIFCNEILGKIAAAREVATKQLLSLNQPPIWKEFVQHKDTTVIMEKRSFIEDTISSLKDFTKDYSFNLKLHILLILIILFLIIFSFRHLKDFIPKTDIPQITAIEKILNRPVSSSFLLSFLLTYVLYATIPDFVLLINMVFLLVPVLLILTDIIIGAIKRFIYLPIVAALLVQVHSLGYGETLFSRIFLLLIILFGLTSLTLILGKKRLRELVLSVRLGKLMYYLAWVSLVLFSIALLSVIFGAGLLAEFITYATIKSAALALIIYALTVTVNSIIIAALHSKSLQKLNLIRQYYQTVYKRLVNFVNLISWILWLIFSLSLFRVWNDIYTLIKKILTYSLTIGTLELTLLNILVFLFIIWLTLWISRLVRIIMEGEVMPRVKLKRGVPGAISLMIRITLITIGFLLAIAAAGVEMDKLAILLGAFGVGIGFGLQNIFNNLVSGIILAFERPINEGDIIEVGTLWGTVIEIGIRASTVRTFDGAEVIVPNGNLISKELINWTLTDKQRRAEVNVGVKYGTDPEQVLQILRDVAAAHNEVLNDPKPLALFTEFGDSSLNFRLLFWIPLADNRLRIQSEIIVAVNNALKEAGIEIPFPQRDIHMRSMDLKIIDDISSKKNSNK